MTTQPNADLNEVITAAVNARVEAGVLEALSGDEFLGKLITSALQQKIEVPDPNETYRKIKVPFITNLLQTVMREAVKDAARKLVEQERPRIERAVSEELSRSSDELAKQLVGSMSKSTESPYGISVELKFPSRY